LPGGEQSAPGRRGQRVTSVEFADRLPTSAVGKVLRREVKARYWQDARRSAGGA